jgi:CHAT domain-containing protein
VLDRIAAMYRQAGEYAKALEHYNQSLLLSRAVGDRLQQAAVLVGTGAVYDDMGEKQKALDYYNQALPLHRQVSNRRGEAGTLSNIGVIYESLGDQQKALEYFGQALLLNRTVGERSGEATTLLSVARIERKRGNLIEARAHVQNALELVESNRTRIPSQDLRASYLASKQAGYQFYIDLLVELDQKHPSEGYDTAALLESEHNRARTLVETLAEAHADIRTGVDPLLLERERTLHLRLNAKALVQIQLLNSKREKQAEGVEKELDALLAEYQQAQAEIRTKSPRYAALTQSQPLDLKSIQTEVVDADTLLLEYSLGKERSFLWAVTPTEVFTYVLPGRAKIEAPARRMYELLTSRNQNPANETPRQKSVRLNQADAEYTKVATDLSEMLLGPVAGKLGSKRLLIVGEDVLQYVPFGALPKPIASGYRQRTKNEPMIAEHEIVSLPSAAVLLALRRESAGRGAASSSVAVFADPVFVDDDPRVKPNQNGSQPKAPRTSSHNAGAIPSESAVDRSAKESGVMNFRRLLHSRDEADAIVRLTAKDKSFEAIDFASNRRAALDADLSRYRILHFATHGLLNSQHPELSGIVLSLVDEQGRPIDGFLRLHEIYNLKLNSDLVVLSACRTALGKEIKGEGLIGLTRGFMYAGSPSVIASLWSVDDEATAELMKRFYRAMFKDGRRPAAALRAAQVSMWREKRWESPPLWAAFVLQGEWK